MTKKLFATIFILLIFSIFSGCAAKNSKDNTKSASKTQQLARVEVCSANEQTLIDTIEDKDKLTVFNENTSFITQLDGMDDNYMKQQADIKKKLEKYEPEYVFISYKTPVAVINDGALEKVLKITTYKDTNIIKVQIAPSNVKNVPVSSEYLTFYFEASNEVAVYFHSLVK